MKISQANNSRKTHTARGFSSTLLVLSTGISLIIILLVMYQDTTQSQDVQKRNMLSNDYQQREDAFLRALIDIVPNRAMLCMTDNSQLSNGPLQWRRIFDDAMTMANSQTAIPGGVAASLGVDLLENGNSADFSVTIEDDQVVFPVADTLVSTHTSATFDRVSPGIQAYVSGPSRFYPPELGNDGRNIYRYGIGAYLYRSCRFPVISNSNIYTGVVAGWVGAMSNDSRFAVLPMPKNHFRYKSGDTFIARHNWWTFNVDFAAQQRVATGLATTPKQYIFSIYEVPTQLAINSASDDTVLGEYADGTAWGANLAGGEEIFASQVGVSAAGSTTAITAGSLSSRKSMASLDAGSAIGGQNIADFNGNREALESTATNLMINSAGDSGRVAFIPINGGEFITTAGIHPTLDDAKAAAFYENPDISLADHDPTPVTFTRSAGEGSFEPSVDAVSPTSWNYYSRGSYQCKMRVVFDAGGVLFSFEDSGAAYDDAIGSAGAFHNLPDFGAVFNLNGASLTIDVKGLFDLLVGFGLDPGVVNSLYVKYDDGSGGGVAGAVADGAEVLIDNTADLTLATNGFSLVTNSHLVILNDVNVVDMAGGTQVPLSIFAPTTQYGNGGFANAINLTGSRTTTSKSGTSNALDLVGGNNAVTTGNITTNLSSITLPNELPPINMMNWLVVIREKHN